MESKLSRIAAFIDSLPAESALGETQSSLIVPEMGMIGGDNKMDCANRMLMQCDTSVNGGNCHNYNGYCGSSSNGGHCINDDKPTLPNTLCGCGTGS